ncbi:hypothetical protein HXX76_001549 [Chlamydomonas incerta]|uniref:Uncharacterized protein n=1 Tax=Chlamydomonas incerta TaxID=51695 RepID=A0A835WCF5_CHLIN|nr:hypothetical protein HXX76_001549 [Chlamydomonas incerta]|eukprot:KAG2444807.1 hypothetical protein HXX76_001549 [Chlamydomonas incerta]
MLKSPGDEVLTVLAVASQPWPGAAFVVHWGRPEPWRSLPRWRRHRLACLAASSHHPPSLDAALAHCGTVLEADALASAATVGDLETCRRLYETEGCNWDYALVGTAAGHSGSLPVCKWLAEAVPDIAEQQQRILLPAAIFAGHARVVEWALESMENDHDWGGAWVGAAAKAGRVELMQQLAARYPLALRAPRGGPDLLVQVAFGCPLAVLQKQYEPWGRGLLEGMMHKECLLLAAAASPMPDWAEKCDWLWARWGTSAAAFATHSCHVEGEVIGAIMQSPDFPQRLQLLASRGLGSCLKRHAPRAAGIIGSTAAVEFCLDHLPALLREQAAVQVLAGGGGAPAVAAAGGPLPAEGPATRQQRRQLRQQVNEFTELIATAAAEQGHVPVLQLLRRRGFVFQLGHLQSTLKCWVCHEKKTDGFASVRYLLLEDPAALAQAGYAADAWSYLFQNVASDGADLSMLRHLHEQHGAPIDLVTVAHGGSEDALSWALAALEAAGQTPEPLACTNFEDVLSYGNWAAADWLARHGLAPPNQELLNYMLSVERCRISIPNLQWVVGMGSGQDRVQVQAQAQVQWTAELHAALVRRQPFICGDDNEAPGRKQWLAGLIETVAAELVRAVTAELAVTTCG